MWRWVEVEKGEGETLLTRDLLCVTLNYVSRGGCIAQRKRSCFPPSSPRFESRHCQDFFLEIVLLSHLRDWDWDRTHLVLSNGFHKCSSVMSRAKYYKRMLQAFEWTHLVDPFLALPNTLYFCIKAPWVEDLYSLAWTSYEEVLKMFYQIWFWKL